jgi:hypothetical protein
MFKVARPKENLFDVGRYITLILKERHMTVYQLAKNCNLSRKWVYEMLKRKDWQISYLVQFSEFLKDDLLRFYRPSFVPEPVPKVELDKALLHNNALQLQLAERDARIAELEKEVLLLQRDNQTLREVLQVKK